jgi:hypothetical protein
MSGKVNPKTGNLFVIWCDRCGQAVNTHDERDHFHSEQCGGCRRFKRDDADRGHCTNRESVYCGRLMFEHDTRSKWLEGEW